MKPNLCRILTVVVLVVLGMLLFPQGSIYAEAANVVIATGFTRLISHSATGEIADDDIDGPILSASGSYAIFHSGATNLVPNDTNETYDCFFVDLDAETIEVVSKNENDTLGDGYSLCSALTDDGRYVVIASMASNLVATPSVMPDTYNLYLVDRQDGSVTLITKGYDGSPANGFTIGGQFFGNDRYIGFTSSASNLVADDTNNAFDIFVYDAVLDTIEMVAVTHDGSPANNGVSFGGRFSADGRYLTFSTTSTNILSGGNNNKGNVFLLDRNTGAVVLVSKAADGTQGNGSSRVQAISPDGNYVLILSGATNLVPGDTNAADDIFLYDRAADSITLVSKSNANGDIGNSDSGWGGAFSADGRYAVFGSYSTNLVDEDPGGGPCKVFVYDRINQNIRLISKTFDGTASTGDSWGSTSVSANGQYVGFESYAQNLLDGVTWDWGGQAFIVDLALQPLDAPVLVTPGDSSEFSASSTEFSWNTTPHADVYTFEVKKISDNSTVYSQNYNAVDYCDPYTCTLPLSLSLGVDRYKWHVIGTSDISGGTWSAYNTFTVTPEQTRLRSPGINANVYGGRPTFRWHQDTEATSYMIEFYDPSDILIGDWQKNPVCDPYCSYRIPRDMDMGANYGEYTWRVRTISNGIAGPWSEMRTFTYTRLERTWQISPENGFTTADTTPTFEWAEITGATMYLFQVRLPDDRLVGNFLVSDATYCIDGGTCTWELTEDLQPGVTYKWHVRAKNGRNFGRWTAYRDISITSE